MRDATAAEREAYGPSFKHELKDNCAFSSDFANFAHFNKVGDLLAEGKCTVSDIFKSENASCDFRIWLPQGREAHVDIAPKYLGNFPFIYQNILATLNDATVIEHSTNLKWRPSTDSQEVSVSENKEKILSNLQAEEVSDYVRIALPGCEIPKVGNKDKIVLLGAKDGSACQRRSNIPPLSGVKIHH